MFVLGFDDFHQHMTLLVQVLHPAIEDHLLSERPHLLNIQVYLLPVPLGPFIKHSIELLH